MSSIQGAEIRYFVYIDICMPGRCIITINLYLVFIQIQLIQRKCRKGNRWATVTNSFRHLETEDRRRWAWRALMTPAQQQHWRVTRWHFPGTPVSESNRATGIKTNDSYKAFSRFFLTSTYREPENNGHYIYQHNKINRLLLDYSSGELYSH